MEQELITSPTRTSAVRSGSNPYTPEKLLGVGFLGAISGLILYYIYNQLSEDTRKTVKDTVMAGIKIQMAKFAATNGDQ